ncbi:phospholipase-like protein [Tanacetum coccineum]
MDEFTEVSGLYLNMSKRVMFCNNVSDDIKEAILQIVPFTVGKLPVKYLGVPLDYVSKVIIRSKLNYFLLIKQKLDVKRRILFWSTCFGPWLDLMLFDHEPLLIDYMQQRQHKVDDQHHDMPLIYYMEGHSLHFGRREFSLITGFHFGTINFDLHPSSDLKFHNRVFLNKIGFIITNLDIIVVIEDDEMFGKLYDDDAIRLCLLLVVEMIFMGRLLTFKVDDTLFRLVKNLEAWNSFPWGKHLWCHLYDEIKNLKQRHSDEHYYGLKKDRNYVPIYTLSGFIWILETFERCETWWIKDPKVIPRALGWSKKSLFTRSDYSYLFAKESRSTSDLRPTIAEYQSSWWIDNIVYFQDHILRAPSIKEHHSLFETYLAKLEKARKREKKRSLHMKEMIDNLSCSLLMHLDDYLREEELRLFLVDEEKLRCEHEKLITEENRCRLDEIKGLRLEKENMLQLEEQKKNKRKEFMNSSHGKNILAKLAPAKKNRLGSSSGKINSKHQHYLFWVVAHTSFTHYNLDLDIDDPGEVESLWFHMGHGFLPSIGGKRCEKSSGLPILAQCPSPFAKPDFD